MASVQELLLAAQAKQKRQPLSMLADLINSGAQGYSEGVALRNTRSESDLRRAQIAKTLIEAQQAQQEMEAQQQLRKQFQDKLAIQAEQNLRQQQAAVGTKPPAATPAAKFSEKWQQDAKGNISRSLEEVSPKQADVPAGYRMTANGDMEFIPGGPADPAVKQAQRPEIDRPMQVQLASAKADLASTRPMVGSVVNEIDRVQKLNEKSFGGYFGALKMKYLSATDTSAKDNPEFANTADVLNTMQAQVSKVLKSTFGGQLSDGERQYLNQVYGALPNMSRTERDIAMTNVKTMLNNRLKGAQSKLDELSAGAGLDVTPPTNNPGEGQPKATLRWNPKTGKLEPI